MKVSLSVLSVLMLPCLFLSANPDGGVTSEGEVNRWYFGASVGSSEMEVIGHDRSALVGKALRKEGVPVSSSNGAETDDDSSWSVLAGYRFHRFGSVEAQYVDLGEVDGHYRATAGADTLNGTIESSYRAASLSLVGHVPVWKRVELIGRCGAHYWEHEFKLNTKFSSNPLYTGSSSTINDDGVDLVYGAGLEVSLVDHVQVRAEWTRFQGIEEEDGVDTKSLSLIFSF